ncbi:MAG: CHC2 zinc finger domain-containing protein [Verrucomicrobiota bacterium]|jgi:DNA primase catalytic core
MAWRIPETDIDRVKHQTDLLALVQSRGIELKKHGSKDFIGRCPFHPDQDKPNFIVTPAKGLFHCMACGKAGNAIQFVEQHDGVSFRHAFELLNEGGAAAFAAQPLTREATVPRLPCPLDPEADDVTLFGQVVAYYHERLKQSAPARAYLASRGLDSDDLITRFQIGFADRTLGLRLPDSNRNTGQVLRSRLTQLGLWRDSGHEHFNGCIVVPLCDAAGNIVSLYGRRAQRSELKHLYSPGPHRGLFNRQCLLPPQCLCQPEIILCEAVFDALTFYVNGFANVTCLFGTEGFSDELWEAMRQVRCVKLAYDADDAGERAAQRDAERFKAHGIEVFRVRFPHGMDANEYACKVTPAGNSLALLLNSSAWLGSGARPPMDTRPPAAREGGSATGHAANRVQAPPASLAAVLAADTVPEAKEEKPPAPATLTLQQRGDAWFFDVEDREYRVVGIEKTLGTDALKVALRLRVLGQGPALFHLDQVDLCRDAERRRFIERAAEETGLTADLLKRDVGRLLLAVEQAQVELARPAENVAPTVTLSPEEREAALKWLREPNLIGRLREAFHQAGIIGEESNTLVAYLAGVSRKLERPLAIIIQSASAAGKTTLMDAVLSFFPEEERVKYSAMTGQSLYYLGETSLKHKILAVVEEAGAERASYALKLLQSEGELTIASTGKDPATGKMVTQEYHVEGPVMIFLTTTAIDLDEELQNRCLTLAVDESAEQTGRIHRVQRERRTLAGLVAHEERKDLLKQLRNAQRLLSPLAVVNPFAPALTFATARTRNRRDHEKYLTLIDAIALLHQHQREARPLPNAPDGAGCVVEYLEVTLDDIALANELAPEMLGRSLDELPPQTRRLLGHIRELMKQKRKCVSAKAASTFSRRELRDACGWSLTQVRVHLERLVDLEYLGIRHGRFGSQFVYELLLDVDAPEAVAHVGLIDVTKLRHNYKTQLAGGAATLAGFSRGVAGQNGHLAGGGKTTPPPVLANADRALLRT